MRLILMAIGLLLSFNSFANCDRYFIIYIENQTDGDIEFEIGKKEYALKMDHLKVLQRDDLRTIMANSRTPVPSKCQFYINGYDLIKENGESNLTRIYDKIANDGTQAPVNIFTLTHGDEYGEIEVVKEIDRTESTTADKALMNDIPLKLRKRLGIFNNAACYGLSTNLMATKAGFAASVGSDDETLGPLLLRDFLKYYLSGLNLKETAEEVLHNCVNNEEWRQTMKYALDLKEEEYENYCSNAIIAIVGNPKITVNHDVAELEALKEQHRLDMLDFGKTMDGSYGEGTFNNKENGKILNDNLNAFYKPVTPYKKNPLSIENVRYTQQFGDNPVGQVDVDFRNLRLFNYVSIDNLNFSNRGIFGGQVSVINDGTLQAGVIRRDYAKGVLFHVNLVSYKKAFFVTGGDNGKGFTWQYILSGKSNLGYMMLRDKNGEKRHFAHVGATLDNELNFRYKRFSLETNTGYDFMLVHPTSSPFYSTGKLKYNFKKNSSSLGGYADYNSVTGFNAGVTATIDLGIFNKSKKKRRK